MQASGGADPLIFESIQAANSHLSKRKLALVYLLSVCGDGA